jgi:hypothetical protein
MTERESVCGWGCLNMCLCIKVPMSVSQSVYVHESASVCACKSHSCACLCICVCVCELSHVGCIKESEVSMWGGKACEKRPVCLKALSAGLSYHSLSRYWEVLSGCVCVCARTCISMCVRIVTCECIGAWKRFCVYMPVCVYLRRVCVAVQKWWR